MDAVRCLRCRETRWALTQRSLQRLAGKPCEACGGTTVRERRRPGAGVRAAFVERRDRPRSRLGA